MARLLLEQKDGRKYLPLNYERTTRTYFAMPYDYTHVEPDDQIIGTFKMDKSGAMNVAPVHYSRIVTASTIIGTMNRNFYPHKAYLRRDLPGHLMLGIDVFLDNPYSYIDKLEGFNFRSADVMAMCHDIPNNWEPRIRAGIPHFVEEIMRLKGHTIMPRRTLTNILLQKLGTALPDDWDEHPKIRAIDGDKVGLRRVMDWEEAIFKRFGGSTVDYGPYIADDAEKFVAKLKQSLGSCQKKAFMKAVEAQFCLIPGGAGTGKTTLIKTLYQWFSTRGLSVALCAFTGKAAQRMQDVVGHEAKTIHRAFKGGHGFGWGHNEDNPIEDDVTIVDEASMLSAELLYRVVNGTSPNTRIILVGDTNQLQPIGMGCPFADMLRGNLVTTQRLTEIFRTAEGSNIAVNAGEILNGALVRESTEDWIVAQFGDPNTIKSAIKEMVTGLHNKGGKIIDDLLILTPNRQSKQSLSTHWLNKMLHELYMDLVGEEDYRGYGPIKRKVIQTQNNYETWLMNGTLGVQLAEENSSRFFGDTKTFFFDTVGEIELDNFNQGFLDDAYAMTAHKAQGSEAKYVIVVVHSQSQRMLNRKWFYTAVTRAKEKVIVVGDSRGLSLAVSHDMKDNRTTYMAYLIKEKNDEIPF